MWQDGVVEGDKATARQHHEIDSQRSEHIRALLKFSVEPTARSRASRRDLAHAAPDIELRQVRDGSIEELDRFAGQHLSTHGLEFETWLGR